MLLQETMTGEFSQPLGSSDYVVGLKHSPYLRNGNFNAEESIKTSPNVKLSLHEKDE